VIDAGVLIGDAEAPPIERYVLSLAVRRSRPLIPIRVITAVMSAIIVIGLATVTSPGDVLGATTSKTVKCGANVRTSASTTAHVKALIPTGAKVSVVATVSGGSYRTACLGTAVSAKSWYRISAINGKSVSSIYGVTYVYGATSLFKATPYTRYAACTTYARRKPSTSSTARRQLVTNARVLVATTVSGGAWSRTCGGRPVASHTWYRISSINGVSVRSLYGVSYLYAPAGLFKTTASTAPAWTPSTTITGSTATVSSVPALLSALANNNIGLIVVKNGTYPIETSSSQHADALWIGARYAGRTRPVTVRAETTGGVTFDGGGVSGFSCISFEEGAHDQTWDGFNCAHGRAMSTGIVTFGGYAGAPGAHHIVMRHISILASCTGGSTSISSPLTDHAFYFSYAAGGPHDLLFEDINVNGSGHLSSAFHFYHSTSANRNAWNVTVRRLYVTGTQQAVVMWDPTLANITFDTVRVLNALDVAVRYETVGSTGIHLNNITSTGSGTYGFYSTQGKNPAGVSFSNDSFH
jgi:hypothetical protein